MEESNFKILSKCKNGKIFRCASCDKIHVEYKNFYFSFEDEEYNFFKKFFMNLDYKSEQEFTKNELCQRRLKVSVGHPNLIALFNSTEIDELKTLLRGYRKQDDWVEIVAPEAINKQFSNN